MLLLMEMGDEDSVAGYAATREGELLPTGGPGKV